MTGRVRQGLRAVRDWLRGADLLVLLACLVVALGVLAFLAIADSVREGDTRRMDERILLALRNPDNLADPVGPPALEEVGRDLTALGGVAVLTLLTAGVTGFLLLAHRFHMVLFVLAAVLGGWLLSTALKESFDRDRPALVPYQASHVMTPSFPSGHSMLSAVVYLTLAALLARLTPQRVLKVYFVSLALLVTFLVGCSRVYLGVHWPTDVLAGWSVGLSWAVLCWLVARHLQHKGTVEADVD